MLSVLYGYEIFLITQKGKQFGFDVLKRRSKKNIKNYKNLEVSIFSSKSIVLCHLKWLFMICDIAKWFVLAC